jgi:sec-independent protein translocase protein TatC|uniref:Sec-independent protein translocase n=2 Tax=Chrysochromulina TaxID=35140 RepID=A0A075DVU4_9EUKA|nr:sec-independent protein translocase [Chrysochromulina parva]AHY04388.1 sec-independent protein translocase [Chrysochromulina tobinii]AUS84415.1 sec-independent protein translocase [Chrysochromulina parva]
MILSEQKQQRRNRLSIIKMLDTEGDEMALSEHIEEFSQRIVFCILNLILSTLLCFSNVKDIVKVFQAPAIGVKFLQFAPGEYFFASFKIALFSGILISSPIILYQVLLYLIPGLTKNERNIILPVSLGSGVLFFCGLLFSYFFLVPAALNFFISYGSEVVEPFWSFDQYFDFIAVLMFATGLSFQVPAIQVVLGLLGIVSGKTMLSYWKYVIVSCTIIAAIITPSTDPITQLLMSTALLTLYLGGSGFVILLKKEVL